MTLVSPFISNPVQVVEDRRESEKLQGSKKLSAVAALSYPIPNLRRRRTSVAHITWNSNDVRSLYNGAHSWYLCSDDSVVKCGDASVHRTTNTSS